MNTAWLHYGGDAIELGENVDTNQLEQTINATPRPGWLTITDKDHNTHRLRISDGVSVRITTVYVPEPAKPIMVFHSDSGPNIRDIGF